MAPKSLYGKQVTHSSQPMADSNSNLIITVFAAVVGIAPRESGSCVLKYAGCHTRASLLSIVPEVQDTRWQAPVGGRPHWSRLATIKLEVSASDLGSLFLEGRAHSVEIWDAGSWTNRSLSSELSGLEAGEPFATGLIVGTRLKTAGEEIAAEPALCGLTVWFTGLSGAGKTTIAKELEIVLGRYSRVELLDADAVRTHICKGLAFSEEDRRENIRRLGVLAKLLAETGAVVLVSAISPYRAVRDEVRKLIGSVMEVYVNAPLSVCEDRDVKGLYKRARRGEIQAFTGIDDPYETPLNPEIECRTDLETVAESVAKTFRAVAREVDLREAPADTTIGGTHSHGS